MTEVEVFLIMLLYQNNHVAARVCFVFDIVMFVKSIVFYDWPHLNDYNNYTPYETYIYSSTTTNMHYAMKHLCNCYYMYLVCASGALLIWDFYRILL